MKTSRLIILSLITLLLAACSKEELYVVHGQVIDASTQEIIPNAQLRVIAFTNGESVVETAVLATAESGPEGYFTISFESDNRPNYYLKVEKPGMESAFDYSIEQAQNLEVIMELRPTNLQ